MGFDLLIDFCFSIFLFEGVFFWGQNERGKAGGDGSGPGRGGQEEDCVSGDMRCRSVISHVL